MRIILVLVIFCALASLPAYAAQAPSCGADAYADVLWDRVAEIEAASDDDAYALLIELKTVIGDLEAGCGGGVYEGTGSKVVGPITFENSVYVLRGDFESIASVTIEPVSGECNPFFLMMAADINGGPAEAVFRPQQDCVGLVQVSGGMGDWTFAIERMS